MATEFMGSDGAPEWVAITGLGVVSSAGLTASEFARVILAGETRIGDFAADNPDASNLGLRFQKASPVRGFEARAHFDDKTLQSLDRFTQFAVAAARQAIVDAGLIDCVERGPGERIGVIIGTANGGMGSLEDSFERVFVRDLRPRPLTLAIAMGGAPVSWIARELGACGPSFGVTSACASAAHAIALGAWLIRTGAADVMIVGGADASFSAAYLKAWDSLRAVAADECRPFSLGRKGLSIGEGAAVFVLERADRARARGASIHAFLAGAAVAVGCGDLTTSDQADMVAVMRRALADAGLRADDVDYVNAHATGAKTNDALEAGALRELFSGHGLADLSISSTKGAIGHAMGASGALELLAVIEAMRAGIAPPTLNFLGHDPQIDLDVTPNAPRRRDIAVGLSNSFGFGSFNAALVVAHRDYRDRP